ncbi:hypothetical protein QBC34DRAFT_415993 [Podospora aff. communis PSN243]|uniref:ER-bound oxygenase mpaB/mpaB'/Rubber oxygenase catalytic domain-containing protein n=1 Tax=Podospora aff. communis PSN243 TaxID=3040156 RepID=A0AAV9G783_9PEZI|nr:hypothetical protein QBC34DRAFT_415993 [Podospora aff. communis PSN243]
MDVLKLGWPQWAVIASLYLITVRALRYRRRDKVTRRFPTREAMATMTVEDAYEIQRDLNEVEFPYFFTQALFFGFFKTYGIPTISDLLMKTGQLSKPENASKRTADTGAVLSETNSHPQGERRIQGLARMNYMHGLYRKSGKILDDDMLYTLSLLVTEPIKWVERIEWRPLTDAEMCALGVYWKDTGDAMDISFEKLMPYMKGKPNDGLTWTQAIMAWSEDYERENMVPMQSNKELGRHTLDILLRGTPEWMLGAVNHIASSIMDTRLRRALMIEDPPQYYFTFLGGFLNIRRFMLRYLALPRPGWMRMRFTTDDQNPDPETGKYHALHWNDYPWYVKPTFWNRWGPGAILTRLTGGVVPGDPQYIPGGYLASELGPEKMRGKGDAEMEKNRAELRERTRRRIATGGCPMPFH